MSFPQKLDNIQDGLELGTKLNDLLDTEHDGVERNQIAIWIKVYVYQYRPLRIVFSYICYLTILATDKKIVDISRYGVIYDKKTSF